MPPRRKSQPEGETTAAPAKRGRGRPPKLTPELLKAVADAIRCGAPIRSACQAEGINRSSYYEWKARGDADRATGRRSLYAEFSDTVRVCEAKGEVGFWAGVALGVKTGKREHVAAGALALKALRTRWGKRYRYDERSRGTGTGAEGEGDEQTKETGPALDLKRLERAEVAELRRLLKKARGA